MMIKKLTLREKDILSSAIYLSDLDNNGNDPDGVILCLGGLLDIFCEQLSFEISQKDKDAVIAMVKEQQKK